MFNALIGFGGFVVVLTAICVVSYIYADSLEAWAKAHFHKDKPAS